MYVFGLAGASEDQLLYCPLRDLKSSPHFMRFDCLAPQFVNCWIKSKVVAPAMSVTINRYKYDLDCCWQLNFPVLDRSASFEVLVVLNKANLLELSFRNSYQLIKLGQVLEGNFAYIPLLLL